MTVRRRRLDQLGLVHEGPTIPQLGLRDRKGQLLEAGRWYTIRGRRGAFRLRAVRLEQGGPVACLYGGDRNPRARRQWTFVSVSEPVLVPTRPPRRADAYS